MNEEEPSYNESLATCERCEQSYWASESDAEDYENYCSYECETNSECCDSPIEFGLCTKCKEHI